MKKNRLVHKPSAWLILLLLLASCSSSPLTYRELRPEITDGILKFPMNTTNQDERLIGVWTAPQWIKDKPFVRGIRRPDSGMYFDVVKAEPMVIDVEMAEPPGAMEIKINESSFPVSKSNFSRVIPQTVVRPGRNRLLFSFPKGEKAVFRHVKIYPKRFQKIHKTFDSDTDFLTPSRIQYFLNPDDHMELRLTFLFNDKNPVPATVTIDSEKSRESYELRIRAGKTISIKPIDDSLQKIQIDFPETPSGQARLIESRSASRPPKPVLNVVRTKPPQRDNVIIILLDAARADHFGCFGYKRPTTPNIDALAGESYVFGNAVCEAAYTVASTGTLLTGLPPDFHGVVSAFFSRLKDNIITVPQLFSQAGYYTAAVSSNPFFGKAYDYQKGFSEFIDFAETPGAISGESYLGPLEKILENKGDKPFFIYLHLKEPHTPYSMPKPYFGRYQKRYLQADDIYNKKAEQLASGKIIDPFDLELLNDLYDENLSYADFVVGKILELLKEKNLSDRTIKIIMADHGEALGEHKLIGHNIALNGEGIRIPLIVSLPGEPRSRKNFDHPVITSDLIVTLCRLCGISYPYPEATMGKDLFTPDEKRIRFCRSMILSNQYTGYMVESNPYKLILFPSEGGTAIELYDIRRDPEEKRVLENAPLPYQAMRYFLNDYLRMFSRWDRKGSRPSLSNREIERLKTLGYLE